MNSPERGRGRLSAIGMSLAAPAILYFIVRGAAVAVSPMSTAALPPRQLDPIVGALSLSVMLPNHKSEPRIVAMAQNAARQSPLLYQPYLIAAQAAADAGNLPKAIALAEVARQRRPMWLPVRLQLAGLYGAAGRYRDLIGELNVILKRNEDARRVVLAEFVKLLTRPDGRAALAMALAGNPEWHGDFVKAAGAVNITPGQARDLIDRIRAQSPDADIALELTLYANALVKSGDVAAARAIWLKTVGQTGPAIAGAVVNPSFQRVRFPPPFGWEFDDTEYGRAEIVAPQGAASLLDVQYFGGSTVTLAQQLVALAPGKHTLTVAVRADDGIGSQLVRWQIRCHPNGAVIARLPITKPSSRPINLAVNFGVPSSCSGQELQLVGEPGDVSEPISLQVHNVTIR